MSRDDSALYTGTTSASFTSPKEAEVKQQRQLAKQARLETAHKLKPAAEPVLALIDKHKQAAMHVIAVATSDAISDKEAGELLRSQRKIYLFLLQFEKEIQVVLREQA